MLAHPNSLTFNAAIQSLSHDARRSTAATAMNNNNNNGFDEVNDIPQESRVAKRLSDRTTKRTLVLVIVLVLMFPFLGVEYWNETSLFEDHAAQYLSLAFAANTDNATRSKIIAKTRKIFDDGDSSPDRSGIIRIQYFGEVTYFEQTADPDLLRDSEKNTGWSHNYDLVIFVDRSRIARLNAILSMLRTVWICVLLTVAALTFLRDANVYALEPLARIVEKVNRIARDPLSIRDDSFFKGKAKSKSLKLETVLIELSLIHI
eukprot:TRINITY_DN14695_c0_g1_i1.p1 TRINITY_DN14695_c0_g1~~TRINITY_DN14695_c0_g1_i1.p1  ORF type:complete len:261 (-),score=11.75 TRINITY_DN14695_c0_g1_i1:61-843(-)